MEPPVTHSSEGGLGFGEISFGGPAAPEPTTGPLPPQPEPTPQPQPPVLPEAAAPASAPIALPLPAGRPAQQPMARSLRLLVLLLLLLGGAGSYLYFTASGQQLLSQLQQLGGAGPAGPAEQRIGLNIAGSSYVDNRETGPLLVIQGTATNNFAGARSAITVKGILLNAGGKLLQQQTVYCGNYLSEDRLKGMRYAQIEEAMSNQFGDGLANMNVRPGTSLRFTIVFRNVPQDLGSINVEVADSQPGGA